MPMLPIADLLAYHARRDPDRAAVIYQDTVITRAELEAMANRAAREFADLGVVERDRVAVALPNSPESFAAFFGALKLGATPMPLSHRLPHHELQAIIDLATPRVLIGPNADGPAQLPIDWRPDSARSAEHIAAPISDQPNRAMTSGGSTGRPKIIISLAPARFDPEAPSIGMTRDGVQLVPGPLFHNGPYWFSNQGLCVGATMVLMPRFDAAEALRLIGEHRVDWVQFVPTMAQRIWRLPEEVRAAADLSSLRVVFSTGAAFAPWLKTEWIHWIGPERYLEAYGGTETSGGTVITGTEALERPGSVGKPNPTTKVRILDADGNDAPAGEVGEIFFRPIEGPAFGNRYRYIGAEPRTAGEWESLGDMGYLDADGYLYLSDRRTDMIVTGGENVYPAEIEAALDQHPAVRSSAAIGLPDDDLGQRIHAIVDVADATVDVDELRAFVGEHLVRYKVPRTFEIVHEPLRNDAGKVRRRTLREERIAALGLGPSDDTNHTETGR